MWHNPGKVINAVNFLFLGDITKLVSAVTKMVNMVVIEQFAVSLYGLTIGFLENEYDGS